MLNWMINVMDYEKIIINVLKLIYFIFNNVVQAHGCFLQYAIFKVEVGRIGLIKKKKRIETTYEKYAQLIWNFFNVTDNVLLLHAYKCRPTGGVI